jgi:energy-coupling factor transporter ATP-binding protein EcfA2
MRYQIDRGSVSVDGKRILDHISFQIRGKDKIGIVGANGAGKTTLLHLIDGQISLERDEKDFSSGIWMARNTTIGILEQTPFFEKNLPVSEIIESASPVADPYSRERYDFEVEYHKIFTMFGFQMSELEKPILADVLLRPLLDDVSKAYTELSWEISIPPETSVRADASMLRQVLMNLTKNAAEADAKKMVIIQMAISGTDKQAKLYIGNDGNPIPAENRQSLFVPFFTTKRSGSGIGLSLSRRMMIQQGGMLDLAEKLMSGCHVGFILNVRIS